MTLWRRGTSTQLPADSTDQGSVSNLALAALAGTFALVVIAGSALWFTRGGDRASSAALAQIGVKTFRQSPSAHVKGEVDYSQSPPVGGNHNSMWLNCGYYANPVVDEMAVHSLEHGAAWITYRPGLSTRELDELKRLSREDYTLVSPYEGLESAIVLSSWGKQLPVEFAEDPALRQFLDSTRQGPDTPEPGAPCRNGVGRP